MWCMDHTTAKAAMVVLALLLSGQGPLRSMAWYTSSACSALPVLA